MNRRAPGSNAALICLSGTVTAAYAVVWLVLASTSTARLTSSPTEACNAPSFLFMPESNSLRAEDLWYSDVRGIYSPILFALPTPVGYSRLGPEKPSVEPSLRLPALPSLFAPRGNLVAGPKLFSTKIRMELSNVIARSVLRIELPEEFIWPPGEGESALALNWQDGAPEWLVDPMTFFDRNRLLMDRPWEARAILYVNPSGEIDHVFMVLPAPDRERNDALANALRALRAKPGQQSLFRVQIYAPARRITGGQGS